MPFLKLIALDTEDLAVVSAHAQDAVMKVGDMAYLPRQTRFAAVMRRFDWDNAASKPTGNFERRQAALRIERVSKAQIIGFDLKKRSEVLSLLAISFVPETADDPRGALTLQFSGGAAIRLAVECIELELTDLGPAWRAKGRPTHPESDAQ